MDDLFGPLEEKIRTVSIGSTRPYEALREIHEPTSVLYPSSAQDATPATVFENTTFVDIDEEAVKTLQGAGFNAHHTDIRNYQPQEAHDLLILLNPQVPASWATPHLSPGGYVLANDYHATASELNATEGFELIATISGDGAVSHDLEGHFKLIDMDTMAHAQPERYRAMLSQRDMFIEEGILDAKRSDPEQDKWRSFFEATELSPYERTASLYVFRKSE